MRKFKYLAAALVLTAMQGCGKSDLEIEKEKIRKDANDLKIKIDSTQKIIDSANRNLESIKAGYRIDSSKFRMDSTIHKINPLK